MQSPSDPPTRKCAGENAAANALRFWFSRSITIALPLTQKGGSSASVCQSKLADTYNGDTSFTTSLTLSVTCNGVTEDEREGVIIPPRSNKIEYKSIFQLQ
jgi:hypothetical protein